MNIGSWMGQPAEFCLKLNLVSGPDLDLMDLMGSQPSHRFVCDRTGVYSTVSSGSVWRAWTPGCQLGRQIFEMFGVGELQVPLLLGLCFSSG